MLIYTYLCIPIILISEVIKLFWHLTYYDDRFYIKLRILIIVYYTYYSIYNIFIFHCTYVPRYVPISDKCYYALQIYIYIYTY